MVIWSKAIVHNMQFKTYFSISICSIHQFIYFMGASMIAVTFGPLEIIFIVNIRKHAANHSKMR